MLLQIWAWWGNVGLGTWTGGGFAFLVMTNWYCNVSNRWAYGDESASSWMVFFAHVVVALVGGLCVGIRAYHWGQKRVEEYDAATLYDRWIKNRVKKEMAPFVRGRRTS
jgi:hypothetical protein